MTNPAEDRAQAAGVNPIENELEPATAIGGNVEATVGATVPSATTLTQDDYHAEIPSGVEFVDLGNTSAQSLRRELATQDLDDTVRRRLKDLVDYGHPPEPVVTATSRIVTSEAFSQLTTDERLMLMDILEQADTKALSEMARLFERQVRSQESGEIVPAILDTWNGQTLLEHLHTLSQDRELPHRSSPDYEVVVALNERRAELLNAAIAEVGNPLNINQGDAGSCAVCIFSKQVARNNPAEYAGMLAGLVSGNGRVTLDDGSVLERIDDSITEIDKFNLEGYERSYAEAILQSALMAHAGGKFTYFDFKTDQLTRRNDAAGWDEKVYRGLHDYEMRNSARALGGDHLELYVGSPATVDAIQQMVENGESVAVSVWWDTSKESVHIAHMLEILDIDDEGMVHFYNPHGELDKMSLAELEERLRIAILDKEVAAENGIQHLAMFNEQDEFQEHVQVPPMPEHLDTWVDAHETDVLIITTDFEIGSVDQETQRVLRDAARYFERIDREHEEAALQKIQEELELGIEDAEQREVDNFKGWHNQRGDGRRRDEDEHHRGSSREPDESVEDDSKSFFNKIHN